MRKQNHGGSNPLHPPSPGVGWVGEQWICGWDGVVGLWMGGCGCVSGFCGSLSAWDLEGGMCGCQRPPGWLVGVCVCARARARARARGRGCGCVGGGVCVCVCTPPISQTEKSGRSLPAGRVRVLSIAVKKWVLSGCELNENLSNAAGLLLSFDFL